jgi:hypothetical protein
MVLREVWLSRRAFWPALSLEAHPLEPGRAWDIGFNWQREER